MLVIMGYFNNTGDMKQIMNPTPYQMSHMRPHSQVRQLEDTGIQGGGNASV